MSDQDSKKSPAENFAEMMKEFGSALAEIFNDPKLKEKAKEFGESATASAKAFADRFKDEDVKSKFKNLGKTAKNFGDSVSEYFKDSSEKSQSTADTDGNSDSNIQGGGGSTRGNPGGEAPSGETSSGEKSNAGAPSSETSRSEVSGGGIAGAGSDDIKKNPENTASNPQQQVVKNSAAAKTWTEAPKKEVYRDRGARITGYAFAIAWSIIFIIFFNFFNRYIAYYVFDASAETWEITPVITSAFGICLIFINASLLVNILGNIILIINDSFYFNNITNIVMHLFGIIAVSALLMIFPFDFTLFSFSVFGRFLVPVLKIIFIIIIVGFSADVLVRFIKIIVRTVKTQ
ncbi:MAG: hypothetical protein FJW66_04050 [Actinobacteria bacterium]|nr:hypothetical protein [Actinomycetota bacterium]